MAAFTWRGISGAFGTAADWIDTTTGANPAPTAPGTGDVATFSGGSGDFVTGTGSVQSLVIQPSASGVGWFFDASITAQSATIAGQSFVAPGYRLTLSGVASAGAIPFAGVIDALVGLSGATLDSSAGSLSIGVAGAAQSNEGLGNTLGLVADSTAIAEQMVIGLGESGGVLVSDSGTSLSTVVGTGGTNAGQLTLGVQAVVSGVTTTAAAGALTVQSGGTVNVAGGLNDGNDGSGSVAVGAGGSMTVSGSFSEIGNLAGALGLMTVSSGGTFTLASGQLAVGNQAGASGYLTVSAGGRFLATEAGQTVDYVLEIGNHAASGAVAAATGTVTVTGPGALLDTGQNGVSVGFYGAGTLNVMSGGVVRTVSTNSTGSNGSITSLSSLAVGRYGTGTVNITGSGSVISATGGLYDGRAAGGNGVINVTSGGVLDQLADQYGSGGIGIGQGDTISGQQASGGTGTLDVNTSGAVYGAGGFTVGNNGCTGFVSLDTGATASVGGQIAVGTGGTFGNGHGTVTVAGGASLRTAGLHATGSAGITVANQVSTVGSITVTGGGSVLDAGGDRIAVGARGVGTLVVAAGATASAGSTLYSDAAAEAGFTLGANATGSGTALIENGGSVLAVDGAITVAGGLTSSGGSGSLSVVSGAVASATGVVLWAGGTLAVDGASVLQIGSGTAATGGIAIAAGATLTAHGGVIGANLSGAGTLSNDGALTVSGAVTGVGAFSLLAGSVTTVTGGVTGGSVAFTAATGTLALGRFAGAQTVSAMQAGDVIDLLGITDAAVHGSDVRAGTGDLAFTNLGGLALQLASDGMGGTDVTVGVACYCRGTAILTDRGERAVEELCLGDRLRTGLGEIRPLLWVGRRSYGGRFLLANRTLRPVILEAGSLGGGLPRRALRVSQTHAMFLDGVLIPAFHLVNGDTIRVDTGVREVDYFHLELDTHDLVHAEGALSETFVDDSSRLLFHNASEYHALYPDRQPAAGYCAPRLTDGPTVEAVRRRLGNAAVRLRKRA